MKKKVEVVIEGSLKGDSSPRPLQEKRMLDIFAEIIAMDISKKREVKND